MFRFEDPWLLSLLALIPLMIFYEWKKIGSSQIRFSSVMVLNQLKTPASLGLRKSLVIFRIIAVALFVLALTRPQSGIKSTEISTEGIDIMLCLDTSGSMKALDFEDKGKRATRLKVVKKVVGEFIKARKNDRIGMVVF